MTTTARRYVGMNEHKDRTAIREAIGVDPLRVPWCGAFMGSVAKRAGRTPPRNYLLAVSWLHFGHPIRRSDMRAGDIAVMRHHVTIVVKVEGAYIWALGGNQSGGVNVSRYRISRVIGVRR